MASSHPKKLEKLINARLDARSAAGLGDENVKPFPPAPLASAEHPSVLLKASFGSSRKNRNLPVVLCLDDMERWSGDLDQCLSYVNQLVEQENYKCILVGNVDEIPAPSMQAFADAREKTIRHVYQFENSYPSIFEIALDLPDYSSKVSERFLRSLVKRNAPVLQRLLQRVSVKNIRTVSEAFQLYDYVFQRNSKLFQGNRNLAFAYLMALQSALILVNKYLLTPDHRNQLMDQDHTEGKGYRYLSDIGYFNDDETGFLTTEAKYLLDAVFYRMDQISLKGLFSIVRNGYYIKADFAGNFENWHKQQQYDSYLDKEKFYQLDDVQAVKIFKDMYTSLVTRKTITNPITILLLAERIIEDMAAGVIELNPVKFKSQVIECVDQLYETGAMEAVEVSIFDLSGDRFVNCRGIYNHVLNRNRAYQLAIEASKVEHFWSSLSKDAQNLDALISHYDPSQVFLYANAAVTMNCLEKLDNNYLYRLINWAEDSIGVAAMESVMTVENLGEVKKLVKMIYHKHGNGVGIRSAQLRRLSRKLKSHFFNDEIEID